MVPAARAVPGDRQLGAWSASPIHGRVQAAGGVGETRMALALAGGSGWRSESSRRLIQGMGNALGANSSIISKASQVGAREWRSQRVVTDAGGPIRLWVFIEGEFTGGLAGIQ